MKTRTADYLSRKKAFRNMMHPDGLKDFLIAEYESSRNIIVKKDILKMIEKMDTDAIEEPKTSLE